MRVRSVVLALAAAAVGCAGAASDEDGAGRRGRALTAEELDQKVLEMLNHPSTTVKVLDIDAGLTSTAAVNLMAHRAGPDGAVGTADDDPFDSIQEVDDVSGVGNATLGQLRAFAETWAPPGSGPPPGDDPDQAVLDMLNHVTTNVTVLDIDAGVTATAAKWLIAHRDGPDGLPGTADDDPFDSIQEVDDVKYVGDSAIEALRNYAATWTPEKNDTTGPTDAPKVVAFLNDVGTTRQVLEEQVGLTSVQSSNLMARRDGPDGELGTADDAPFASIEDVDDVPYIGPKTIQKLVAFAETWAPVDPGQVLEEKVLAFLNHPTTTKEVLDVDVGLTSTAAGELIAHRDGPDGVYGTGDDDPFDSLQEVDDVKYVGASTLGQIQAFAQTWSPPDPGTPPEDPAPEDLPLSCTNCDAFVGDPLEYDPGPPAGSGWAELFASVPNFRVVASEVGEQWLAVDPATGMSRLDEVNAGLVAAGEEPIAEWTLTKEKFRYHMGPLFYRGRLDGTARVLLVGQEGATDEALVHRAFVGGTGQKVQNLVNALGITRSYIFVNTFVYSIYEQYDAFTDDLAMNTVIKDHRNEILKKIFEENQIELVLTFGNAAYQSVRIFRDEVYGGKFAKGTRWSHSLHPGTAAFAYADDSTGEVIDPESLNLVVKSFADTWSRVWYWRYIDPGWLAPDPDGWQFQSSKFFFGDRDIPYRDLPYGASPQNGRGGTKSERAKSGLQVQFRSQNGVRYEAPDAPYPDTPSKALSGLVTNLPSEVAWEPPKYDPDHRHDPGPSPDWTAFFAMTPPQSVVEEETGVDANNDFHRRPLWYRGRINAPSIRTLVIAQDDGVDQVIAGRTLVGESGQKIGHFLQNIGAGTDYLMISPYPYLLNDTVAEHDRPNMAMSLSLSAYRDQLLARILQDKTPVLVLTFGDLAQAAWQSLAPGYTGHHVHLAHPSNASAPVSWNEGLTALAALAPALGLTGSFTPYQVASYGDVRRMIPREDLPWGVPLWFGTSGDLTQQPHSSWIFWNAPKWIAKEPTGG